MADPVSVPHEATPAPEDFVCGQILAACREGDCPVCAREADTGRRSLEALLHEQVTDPLLRRRLRQSHGLCPAHTRLLASLPHANLAVALIYQDLLQDAHEQLRVGLATGARRRGTRPVGAFPLMGWHQGRTACHICLAAQVRVTSDLTVILQHFAEPAFQVGFARSVGLCLPHLAQVGEMGPTHPNLPAVLAWHEARWRDLETELGEFVRKFDYRYAAEPMGRERDSWLRVLRLFVGTRDGVSGGLAAAPAAGRAHVPDTSGCDTGAGEPRRGE